MNGGSAADAQHLAAEFLIRLRPNVNRHPLPVIAFVQIHYACGNDYKFEDTKTFQSPFEKNVILTLLYIRKFKKYY